MIEVKDISGEIHRYNEEGVRFYMGGTVCRIYVQREGYSRTLASFVNPIYVKSVS